VGDLFRIYKKAPRFLML